MSKLVGCSKIVLRDKFVALNAYFNKEEMQKKKKN